MLSMQELQKFLLEKAILFPSAEIYGGYAGFFDYGPFGTEIKRAVKNLWWQRFVQERKDVVGIDGSVITHPRVWEASGHVSAFHDPLVECKKCKGRFRADHLIEDRLKIRTDGLSLKDLASTIKEKGLKCPACGGELIEPRQFNLMFKTEVGSVAGEASYLRPETAQTIFVDFSRVFKISRANLPFGMAQIGRAFRNEISPRNLVFRAREFEQMEIEYFFNPDQKCGFALPDTKLRILSAEMQEKGQEPVEMSAKALVEKGLTSDWHAYWLAQCWQFVTGLGLKPENLVLRQHLKKELSHYSKDTWDIEYNYPFGWKELVGIANRTDFDLKQHSKFSGKDLSVPLPDGSKVYPWVIEPSFGVDRLVLALICDAWDREKERQVLRLGPGVAPVQVAVFPLVNRDQMPEKARQVFDSLKTRFRAFYDSKGSIGRRYRRQDSIGTPFCVTIDGQTIEDSTVTVRQRDSMEQKRVKIKELGGWLEQHF